MLVRDLKEAWISRYEKIKNHGENEKKWTFVEQSIIKDKKTAFLNFQQDINELDKKPSGEVDYSVIKARTDLEFDIQKGDGISFTDISEEENIIPEYVITDNPKIGDETLYILKKYNGE